jgi:hypothetical protein
MSYKLGQMIDRNPHVKVRTEEGGRPLNNTATLIMQPFKLKYT